jgi:hypothetical protein
MQCLIKNNEKKTKETKTNKKQIKKEKKKHIGSMAIKSFRISVLFL